MVRTKETPSLWLVISVTVELVDSHACTSHYDQLLPMTLVLEEISTWGVRNPSLRIHSDREELPVNWLTPFLDLQVLVLLSIHCQCLMHCEESMNQWIVRV